MPHPQSADIGVRGLIRLGLNGGEALWVPTSWRERASLMPSTISRSSTTTKARRDSSTSIGLYPVRKEHAVMIPELDRYQGVVFRQLLLGHGGVLRLAVADLAGRVDTFSLDGAAFQVKHSSKRLSPWQFTYFPENLAELARLQTSYQPVWVFLVCGIDGVLGLSWQELTSIVDPAASLASSIRVSRSRKAMYRVSGPLGILPRAKSRGVDGFLAVLAGKNSALRTAP